MIARPLTRELLVFGAAWLVLVVHAALDAFLATEPGTGWHDHLARGISTLGVLALTALLYRRLPAGGRGALSLSLAGLALLGTGLAVADARAVGARGEDWTGFLLVPAGLALAILGLSLLWRSRKPGRLRYLRRAGLGLAGILALYWILMPLAMAIVATHRPRASVRPADLGRPYRQVTLRTSDGLDLAAWYVPSRNGAAIVSYPTRSGKLPQARMLLRHGYGVLLVDARGYDGSEGDANAFGWAGAKDLDAAVAWLRRRPDVERGRIGGIGFSVGGEMMLQAAAGNPGLRAVVSEGAGIRSLREAVLLGPRAWLSLPAYAVQTLGVALLGDTAPPPSLERLTGRIAPRPVLLISAGKGTGGEELNADYARAGKATLWKIAEARHTGGFQARPREYERRVTAFFDRALLGQDGSQAADGARARC